MTVSRHRFFSSSVRDAIRQRIGQVAEEEAR